MIYFREICVEVHCSQSTLKHSTAETEIVPPGLCQYLLLASLLHLVFLFSYCFRFLLEAPCFYDARKIPQLLTISFFRYEEEHELEMRSCNN